MDLDAEVLARLVEGRVRRFREDPTSTNTDQNQHRQHHMRIGRHSHLGLRNPPLGVRLLPSRQTGHENALGTSGGRYAGGARGRME